MKNNKKDIDEQIPKALRKKQKKNTEAELKTKKQLKQELKEEKKKIRKKRIIKLIILIFVVFLIYKGISLAISMYRFKTLVSDMILNENSQVINSEGETIAQIGSEKKKQVADNIPKVLKNAYVAIEDQRYYSHSGVDFKRTSAAIGNYIIHFGKSSFGGSSITQQLVKNLTGDDSNKISRKVSEWERAICLETFLSKEDILNTYLNVIYVGPNVYGVQTGAKYYFDKDVDNLSIAECAFLAGINNAPNSYNPFGEKDNSEKIEKRTKTVLAKMKEFNYINSEEYNEAVTEVEQGFNFKQGNLKNENDGIYSYHTDALITEIITDLANKKHISKSFAKNYLDMAGAKIYSTENTEIQNKIEKEFNKSKYILKSANDSSVTSQAAMVIIDQKTGQVVGCVGGLGEKKDARGLNRATQAVRQVGSAGKPLSVLVPAIEKKIITASSIYDDSKTTFENDYAPGDYDAYQGNITVRRAVESSQNIPFVKIMEQLTPKTSIQYLKKMGITTLTQKDESLPLALGGLEKGISPLEMASAYATIANDGVYIEPTFYKSVMNSKGKVIIEKKAKSKKVFSIQTAFIVKELLRQPVIGSKGTATYCNISGMDVSAKTGTTDENYDRWLCGFTPYYTAVTWYGFDLNESINFNGKNPAGLIWADVMKNVHSNLKGTSFAKPSGIIESTVCAETGLVANVGCINTYTEYYLKGTLPDKCNKHLSNNYNNTTKSNNKKTEVKTETNINKNEEKQEKNVVNETTTTKNNVSTDETIKSENKNTTKNNITKNSTNTSVNTTETNKNNTKKQNTTNKVNENTNTN